MPSTPESFRRVSRVGGVAGLVLLVLAFGSLSGGDNPFFSDASHSDITRWVHAHQTALYVEGVRTWLTMLLVATLIVVLLWRTAARGTVVQVVVGLLAANLAVDMVWGGSYYALAKAAELDVPDSGILALFAFVQELTFTDGVFFGLATLVVSWLALRGRVLPAPIAWLGVAVGAFHVVSVPLQVLLNGTVEGPTGPVSAISFLLWVLATALTLLIRPGTGRPEVAADHPLVPSGT